MAVPACLHKGPVLVPGLCVRGFWSTKWHWDKHFSCQYYSNKSPYSPCSFQKDRRTKPGSLQKGFFFPRKWGCVWNKRTSPD